MPSHYLLTACLLSMCDHVVLLYVVRCTHHTSYVMRYTCCTSYVVPPYCCMVAPSYGGPDKIDHVFVHALLNRQQLFLIITKVTQTAAMDQILGLPMLDTQNKQELIGLPAVAGRCKRTTAR